MKPLNKKAKFREVKKRSQSNTIACKLTALLQQLILFWFWFLCVCVPGVIYNSIQIRWNAKERISDWYD